MDCVDFVWENPQIEKFVLQYNSMQNFFNLIHETAIFAILNENLKF